MPFIRILPPNDPGSATARQLMADVARTASERLGKPESIMMVRVEPGAAMTLGGSDEPSAYVDVHLIGLPAGDRVAGLAEALTTLVTDALAVPRHRVFVVFTDVPRSQWAVGGKMLA